MNDFSSETKKKIQPLSLEYTNRKMYIWTSIKSR